MYAVYKCAFNPDHGVSLFQEKDDLPRVWGLFPVSPLLKFKRADLPPGKPGSVEGTSRPDPEFFEADYFLGNEALSGGNLLEAEEFYLKSLAGIPGSPQTTISLAAIAFAMEEFERSLEHYEKTLALAPVIPRRSPRKSDVPDLPRPSDGSDPRLPETHRDGLLASRREPITGWPDASMTSRTMPRPPSASRRPKAGCPRRAKSSLFRARYRPEAGNSSKRRRT